jgi:hypothetical protein
MTHDPGELVAEFYEAALEPTHYPAALQALASFGGGVGAILLAWDKRVGRVAFHATSGHMSPDSSAIYRRDFAALDPYRVVVETLPTGSWTTCAAFFDRDYVARSAFYNEYLIPRGTRFMSGARVLSTDDIDAHLGVHRGVGTDPLSHDDINRLQRVCGQLGGALRLHFDTARARLGAEAASAGLDALDQPALLIDADDRVLYANAAAETFLRTAHRLTVARGRLTAPAAADADRLQGLVQAATREGIGGELRLGLPSDTTSVALTVAPAGPFSTLYGLAPVTAALVIVRTGA